MACNLVESCWSEPVLQELKTLHEEGVSHGIIARRLNEKFSLSLTRNACIGKARREGLTRPLQDQSGRNRARLIAQGMWLPSSHASEPKKSRPQRMIVIDLKAPEGVGVSLDDLRPFTSDGTSCRYPLGMSERAGQMFCGEPTQHGSWCPYHRQIVFRGGRLASAA